MRTGSEVKVGLITLLAIALLVLFALYFRGYRGAAATYAVTVIFDDARGLVRGDPVRMVGVKIGEVRLVQISPDRKAEVTLAIDREHELYDNYAFRIGTSGLIQERFVEVVPQPRDPYANRLADGDRVEGLVRPDLAAIMEAGSRLLDNLDRTSRRFDLVLGDQEILMGVKRALENFSELATSLSTLTRQSEPQIVTALEGLSAAAADMRVLTNELRTRLSEGRGLEDLDEAARLARQTAEHAERITADLEEMMADPELRDEVRGTISALHEAAQTAKRIGADLEVFSQELRGAAPAVPQVVREAEGFADATAALRERLKPPEINAAFDLLYGLHAGRSYSSGRLDVETSEDRFLRFGIDDIGEESDVNIQLGERQRRAVVRYGLVRSRLGLGLDFSLPRDATLSLDVFDPNDLRADVLADIPLVPGRSDWTMLAGMRDVGDESSLVAGIRLKK